MEGGGGDRCAVHRVDEDSVQRNVVAQSDCLKWKFFRGGSGNMVTFTTDKVRSKKCREGEKRKKDEKKIFKVKCDSDLINTLLNHQ